MHVSEVSWDLVQDVRDVLFEGDEVRVKIVNIDRCDSAVMLLYLPSLLLSFIDVENMVENFISIGLILLMESETSLYAFLHL